MRTGKRLLALLIALLIAALPALAEGMYYGSYPNDDVINEKVEKKDIKVVTLD